MKSKEGLKRSINEILNYQLNINEITKAIYDSDIDIPEEKNKIKDIITDIIYEIKNKSSDAKKNRKESIIDIIEASKDSCMNLNNKLDVKEWTCLSVTLGLRNGGLPKIKLDPSIVFELYNSVLDSENTSKNKKKMIIMNLYVVNQNVYGLYQMNMKMI